jgi:hypothetical protein
MQTVLLLAAVLMFPIGCLLLLLLLDRLESGLTTSVHKAQRRASPAPVTEMAVRAATPARATATTPAPAQNRAATQTTATPARAAALPAVAPATEPIELPAVS